MRESTDVGTEVGADTGLSKMATDAARTRPDATSDGIARGVTWLLALGGLVGFAASFTLLVEKFACSRTPTTCRAAAAARCSAAGRR